MKSYFIINLLLSAIVLIGIAIIAVAAWHTYASMKAEIAELQRIVDEYERMIYGHSSDKNNRGGDE